MLCDAFCPHTALPRVKGMHQPRDSAVFFSTKQISITMVWYAPHKQGELVYYGVGFERLNSFMG